jgi:hypothetical protein
MTDADVDRVIDAVRAVEPRARLTRDGDDRVSDDGGQADRLRPPPTLSDPGR